MVGMKNSATVVTEFNTFSGKEPFSLSIGAFDGVHLGHQQIIKRAIDLAKNENLKSGVLTFEPHPQEVLIENPPKRLNDISLKTEYIKEMNPDYLMYMRFDKKLSMVSAEDFIKLLLTKINLKYVVVGENFKFGNKATGTTDALTKLGLKFGFTVEVVPLLNIADWQVSSTLIRELLSRGNIEDPSLLLGRHPLIRGDVVHGTGRGKKLGFPTINIFPFNPGAVPADGVYGGIVTIKDGEKYKAAISIGKNPTFADSKAVAIEAFIIDFNDRQLYGQTVDIEIHFFVRGQLKFWKPEYLAVQIMKDVKRISEADFLFALF